MKLYYSPGACSLSPHIALCEAGIKFDLVKAQLKTHTLADGSDYYQVTAKGQVPLLELDDDAPASGLAPAAGTMARYRVTEWLNFITSELHKGFAPLFNPAMPQEAKEIFAAKLKERFAYVDARLEGNDYLMGQQFSVADTYLFTMTNWAAGVGVDITGFKNVEAFRARMLARPAVQEAMKAEGLLK
jgi:glutathione S-transferase